MTIILVTMSPLLLSCLLLQAPAARAIAVAEYQRSEDVSVIIAGLKSADLPTQRAAARAAGRLERAALAEAVLPLLKSPDPEVRLEAVAALAQMGARFDFAALLPTEKSGAVRAVVYEALGRSKPPVAGGEGVLVRGLKDDDITARTGAARGLETMARLGLKTMKMAPTTIEALRQAVREDAVSRLRQFALLALNAAGDQDAASFDIALRDPEPQVRRLAVLGSKRWVDDPSPIVRLEAIRLAGTCERALAGVEDPSGHVALAAIDFLGAHKCDATVIEGLVDRGKSWRIRAHAIVALAKVAPESARMKLPALRADAVWQLRAYVASAAKLLKDEATLAALAGDLSPNVAAAAMNTAEQALRALTSGHSGLLLAAAGTLKGTPELKSAAPRILETVQRLTREDRVTLRDARVGLIELLAEAGDTGVIEKLRPLVADPDPAVAALVAKVLSPATGNPVEPRTTRYVPNALFSALTLRSFEGSKALITMKGLGAFTVQLFAEEAPATVATFALLAGAGAYDGLTFHRVVPNFVLQGGSPGADEYDPLTPMFMRDEVGFLSHERGTLGISTRGRDTGDGQIFINLVDNWRLDHTYTVFARVTEGMEIVDRILEGDVIESIVIRER